MNVMRALIPRLTAIAEHDFTRMTYTEAVSHLLLESDQDFEYPVSWGADLQSEHERYITEQVIKGPGCCHGLSQGDQSLLHAFER